MSQINLEEKISEKMRFDYRERLKKIQGDIKNNKSISRIDEIYLKKVLELESLPDDFVKKNSSLRKMDVYNKDKPRIINKIIDEQTKKSLKENLYNDKLKSEVEIVLSTSPKMLSILLFGTESLLTLPVISVRFSASSQRLICSTILSYQKES